MRRSTGATCCSCCPALSTLRGSACPARATPPPPACSRTAQRTASSAARRGGCVLRSACWSLRSSDKPAGAREKVPAMPARLYAHEGHGCAHPQQPQCPRALPDPACPQPAKPSCLPPASPLIPRPPLLILPARWRTRRVSRPAWACSSPWRPPRTRARWRSTRQAQYPLCRAVFVHSTPCAELPSCRAHLAVCMVHARHSSAPESRMQFART